MITVGTSASSVESHTPLGNYANPASSISALRAAGITTEGVYWFSTPYSPSAFQAYCKFSYIDGNDWVLLLKVFNNADLPSGSGYWMDNKTFNDTDFNLTSGTWSKYRTWNYYPFSHLMMNMGGNFPPIMNFSSTNTMYKIIQGQLVNGQPAYNNAYLAVSTTPSLSGHATMDYSNATQFPMLSGSNFSRASGGQEQYINAYGICSWNGQASHANTYISDSANGSLPTVAYNGAWIGAPMDEVASWPFNVYNTNTGDTSDSGFGFGFNAGNGNRTGSCGIAEWQQTNDAVTTALPGYVWVR